MVLYLGRMCQCWLHVVLWSHISILICFLAAEPLSTAEHLFTTQRPCGTILPTLIRWCETGGFQEQSQCLA